MSMESYIVRIYRYNSKQPDKLIGTIEGMDLLSPMAFSSVDELWKAIQIEYLPPHNLNDIGDGEMEVS